MSWWDYGYQITAMANRTIIVDNNTWNNTHISRVGQAMASSEDKAYEIMRELDVDYVLVIFGGLTGYSSDGRNIFSFFNNEGHDFRSLHCRPICSLPSKISRMEENISKKQKKFNLFLQSMMFLFIMQKTLLVVSWYI